MGTADLGSRIADIVRKWEGVEVTTHRFGGVEFRVDRREIGHLHGSRQADLNFPVRVRRALVASGRAEAHHTLPRTGWVSYRIRSENDIPAVLELFRMNYNRLRGAVWQDPSMQMMGQPVMLDSSIGDDLQA